MHCAYEDWSMFLVQKNWSSFLRLPFETSRSTTTSATDTAAEGLCAKRYTYKHLKHDGQAEEGTDGNVNCQFGFLKEEPVTILLPLVLNTTFSFPLITYMLYFDRFRNMQLSISFHF